MNEYTCCLIVIKIITTVISAGRRKREVVLYKQTLLKTFNQIGPTDCYSIKFSILVYSHSRKFQVVGFRHFYDVISAGLMLM
jgi:hypothetical protein